MISPHTLIWNSISFIFACLTLWFSLLTFLTDIFMVLLFICILVLISRTTDGYEGRDIFDPGIRTEFFFSGAFIAASAFTFLFKSGWLYGSSLLSILALILYPIFLWKRILRFIDQRIYPDYDDPRINSDADIALVRCRKIIFLMGPLLYITTLILIYLLKK